MIKLSVIIPTYNPNIKRLNQTLAGLRAQYLEQRFWEILIINNNSSFNFSEEIDVTWHANCKLLSENNQGLTYARIKGFKEAKGEIIVMVDDDNILQPDYLSATLNILQNPLLGAIGGKSLPLFEVKPASWVEDFYSCLGLQDKGAQIIIEHWNNSYPHAAPIGAGMAIKKTALQPYINKIQQGKNIITDRNGNMLSSGGDNDIVIEVLKAGFSIGYFPELILYHIIPEQRIQPAYLARLNKYSSKSWIQLLESHSINPWQKIPYYTVTLRKIKAWFTYKAWLNNAAYINWKGACGTFEGLAIK